MIEDPMPKQKPKMKAADDPPPGMITLPYVGAAAVFGEFACGGISGTFI
jgi:hypothetical protein